MLKLMAGTLLARGRYVLANVPDLSDVHAMADLLRAIGLSVETSGDAWVIHCPENPAPEPPQSQAACMRASTALLGPLLARLGEVHLALPGGDDFGGRPIDLHLAALERLGAKFEVTGNGISGTVPNGLRGARIDLDYPSVGATENAMMAATLAEGRTEIHNAAMEPEIADLGGFLNRMGARVLGAGSPLVVVEGVDLLHPCRHEVVSDRIEATTYLACVGAVGGEVLVEGARYDHLTSVVECLGQAGVRVAPDPCGVWVHRGEPLRPARVRALPYPGVATDFLPMLVAMLAVADGTSFATENIFPGRFRYVDELARMGADLEVVEHHIVIRGRRHLVSAQVEAMDIRAGAALVVASLVADGPTQIAGVHHIERGYERLVDKLSGLGVEASLVD